MKMFGVIEFRREYELYFIIFWVLADLQNLFRTSSQGTNDKLTYEDLENLVGSTVHDRQSFQKFDEDGDGRYSISELKVALGL